MENVIRNVASATNWNKMKQMSFNGQPFNKSIQTIYPELK